MVGKIKDVDILVLPLDMLDHASHKPITDEVIRHFGQVSNANMKLHKYEPKAPQKKVFVSDYPTESRKTQRV